MKQAIKILFLVAMFSGPLGAAETPRLAQPAYWLKTYSMSPVKEHWTANLTVKNLEKDLPKVLAAFEKAGGEMTHPLSNFPSSKTAKTQQISYRLSKVEAKEVQKRLKKLGKLAEPAIRTEMNLPPVPEVKDKIGRLVAAKKDNGQELRRMPDVAAMVDEALEHLFLVEHLQQDSNSEVLLNITVSQTP